ncbi:MAG: substrate-binding domain-containing protein [Anaerolineae bacterium]|nr:substrate-binding domain-containing protein [Anaerolineae bacterium]
MTTFERRQNILRLLREKPGVKVTELAKMLEVSEGTIRNDLTALDEEQLIMRVRGGAVPREEATSWGLTPLPDERANSKQRIARWAAEIIENGDSILLDASTTVMYMASYLRDRRNLTVVTNGIETARRFAENTSNTVILIGGILRPDGTSITGAFSERWLNDLHVQRAFMSCSGFSLESGLTEIDIREAQIKSLMIRRAQQTIALVDSSKFGKVGITPFATPDQISHIFTDSDVSPGAVERLRSAGINLTVCEENTVSSFVPHKKQEKHYKIGFANLGEDMPFPVDVRRGLERVMKHASNIDLIVADNQLNGDIALKNADDLIAKGIDLLIEYQIDEKVGSLIMNKVQKANIPIIAVDIPIIGATYVGIDNYHSGYVGGTALGQWISEHWDGQADAIVVLEEPRAGALPGLRIQGQLDGLLDVLGKHMPDTIYHVNSGNKSEITEVEVLALLERVPPEHHLAFACFNDDAAFGVVTAVHRLNREQTSVIAGQGADRRVRELIRQPGSRIIGSAGFMPEKYGETLLDVALKLLRGEPTPPAIYIQPDFINADNIDEYYPDEAR